MTGYPGGPAARRAVAPTAGRPQALRPPEAAAMRGLS